MLQPQAPKKTKKNTQTKPNVRDIFFFFLAAIHAFLKPVGGKGGGWPIIFSTWGLAALGFTHFGNVGDEGGGEAGAHLGMLREPRRRIAALTCQLHHHGIREGEQREKRQETRRSGAGRLRRQAGRGRERYFPKGQCHLLNS